MWPSLLISLLVSPLQDKKKEKYFDEDSEDEA